MLQPYQKLAGIYHAEGSLLGELRYVLGKLRGTTHCGLCDITHGAVRKKKSFAAIESRLPVPLSLHHLDERDDALAAATEGKTPCVVGLTESGWQMVMDARALDACEGDEDTFERTLLQRLERQRV